MRSQHWPVHGSTPPVFASTCSSSYHAAATQSSPSVRRLGSKNGRASERLCHRSSGVRSGWNLHGAGKSSVRLHTTTDRVDCPKSPSGRYLQRKPARTSRTAPIGSVVAPLNTDMITHLTALTAVLFANFHTVRVQAQDDLQRPPDDWWGSAKAWRAEKRAAYAYRDRLHRELINHGHPSLDSLEADPDGGWRLHIFVADEAAVALLDTISQDAGGPGDPVTLDPEDFISERPHRLQCADECP